MAPDCVPVPAQLFRSSLEPELRGTGAGIQIPLSFLAPGLLEEGLGAVLHSVSLVARTGAAPGLAGKIRMNPRAQIRQCRREGYTNLVPLLTEELELAEFSLREVAVAARKTCESS